MDCALGCITFLVVHAGRVGVESGSDVGEGFVDGDLTTQPPAVSVPKWEGRNGTPSILDDKYPHNRGLSVAGRLSGYAVVRDIGVGCLDFSFKVERSRARQRRCESPGYPISRGVDGEVLEAAGGPGDAYMFIDRRSPE